MLPMEYTSSIGTQIHHTNIFFIYGNTIKEIEIKYEKYLTTYSHTYQIYKKKFIKRTLQPHVLSLSYKM